MDKPIRFLDGEETWIFAGDIGLRSKQIGQLLDRTRTSGAYERDLAFVAAQCFEMYARRIWIWRVPGPKPTFSVVARL